MSRIIVKHLPKNITEENLRNIFGSKGIITDLQLKYTADGRFRQFCFIGYSSEAEAKSAIQFFNNTCIRTSRIKVEACVALGSEEKPQSWSKYAKDSNKNPEVIKAKAALKEKEAEEYQKQKLLKKKTSNIDGIFDEYKNDSEFLEFLKLHDKKRALWDNDVGILNERESQQQQKQTEDNNTTIHNKMQGQEKKRRDSGIVAESESLKNDSEDENVVVSKLAENPISDLEYMKSLMTDASAETKTLRKAKANKNDFDLYTIKIHNVPYKTKRQEIIKFFKPLKPHSVRLPTNVHGFCYVGFKTSNDMRKAMLKNKSFIKGKQVFFSDFTEKNKITKSKRKAVNSNNDTNENANVMTSENKSNNAKWSQQEQSLCNKEGISESGRIFFRNLAYATTEDDLQKLFEQFGPLAEINLPIDLVTRQIKGFGTVTFVMPEHAVLAFNKLDGTDFHGRLLHLIPAKSKDESYDINENEANMSFKQKKALKLKQTAQQAATWNTLFMGANAVADLLAKQFNISKEQILDTSQGGSNAAVRLALGETQLVTEMKQFLEEHNVHLAAFDDVNRKRSKTVILVKNLPADTTVAELSPIFAKFGPIGRIVLPPSGVTALIEYCEPSEARHAFKKLAFSKFKMVPLYLEWAPEHVFVTTLSGNTNIPKLEANNEANATNATEADNEEVAAADDKEVDIADEEANEPAESNTTLFLRNLNFKTVTDTIYKHFQGYGKIHTVEIAKRKDPQNPRQINSLGYGFIQFKKAAVAEKVLKELQLTSIDGNQVELKRSDRILKSDYTATAQRMQRLNAIKHTKQTGSKILVRNIPFQANQKEIRDIFKAFGELRSVRLPRKMTPGEDAHRGFGFVDYVTKNDAKKAFEALSASTHLYGRRLVLEWATIEEESVEVLRKRTAAHFRKSEPKPMKHSKRAVFNMEDKTKSSLKPENDSDL